MRFVISMIFLFIGLNAYSYEVGDLVGKWQSDEKKTLESMESTPGIPEDKRAFFRNGFFGKVIVVSKPNESAVYFVGEDREKSEFSRHIVNKISETQFLIEYPESTSSFSEPGIITLHGDCYSVVVSKWKFNEYFCRVP